MKKFSVIFFCFVILLSFCYCATDAVEENSNEHYHAHQKADSTGNVVYKKLWKNDFPNLSRVNEALTKVSTYIDSSSHSGLQVQDAVALYAEYGGKHTYTFNTENPNRKNDEVENVVLELRADGTYNTYLFRYTLTYRELINLGQLPIQTIMSNTEITVMSSSGSNIINIDCFDAIQNYVGKWQCEAGNEHGPGHPNCQVGGSQWVIEASTLSYIYVGCDGAGGSSGGGGSSGSGGGSTGGGGSGTGGGSSGGSSGSGSGDDGSGGTEPDPDYSFTQGQTLITQPILLELTTPYMIVNLIDDEDLDPCPKSVLDELKSLQQANMAAIIGKLDDGMSIYNTTIKTEAFPTDNGSPARSIRTPGEAQYHYTIKIHPEYTSNTNKLGFATLILHEMLHVYFFSLLDDADNTNPDALNDFPLLFELSVVKNFGLESVSIHHEIMANKYVDIFSRALQEFNSGVAVPESVEPEQIYKDLAWGSLQDASIYQTTDDLTAADRDRINKRYAAEIFNFTVGTEVPAGTPCP